MRKDKLKKAREKKRRKICLRGERKKRILQTQKDKSDFMSNTWAWQQTAISLTDFLTWKKTCYLFCFYFLSASNNASFPASILRPCRGNMSIDRLLSGRESQTVPDERLLPALSFIEMSLRM